LALDEGLLKSLKEKGIFPAWFGFLANLGIPKMKVEHAKVKKLY
jgi:hypothetical protein